MRRLLLLLLLPLTACAPAAGRTDAGSLLTRTAAPEGPLIESRLAFGLRYPEGTRTPGPDSTLDERLTTALRGTQYSCVNGRSEHITLPDAQGFSSVGERLKRIGYTVTELAPDTYLFTRDFDVIAAHADTLNLSLCETRW